MSFTMPYGYGSSVVTEAQLKQKRTFNRLHPHVQARFLAMAKHLASKGIPLGVGTGWRVQPSNKPGFAAPGNSWHEGVPVSSNANALAIDVVPASSWNEMEKVCRLFGFRSFRHVNNEPWHIQPIEIPASRRWATTLPPLNHHASHDNAGGESETEHAHRPTGADVHKADTPSPTLKQGMARDMRVAQLQNICNFWKWGNCGNADGLFGPRTKSAVKVLQLAVGASPDGQYGPKTRASLVSFLEAMHALANK